MYIKNFECENGFRFVTKGYKIQTCTVKNSNYSTVDFSSFYGLFTNGNFEKVSDLPF